MFPLSIRMHIPTLLCIFVLSLAYGQDRKIQSLLNPGCRNCTSKQTLVYIKAVGSHDTVHQIWDFTRGIPTIIFTIGTTNSSLYISWEGTVPTKFWLDEKPQYSFAAVIDQLIEYDDLADNGHIDNSCPQKVIPFREISWNLNTSLLTETEAMVKMIGRYEAKGWENATVEIRLDMVPYKDYGTELPHLIHSANSTLVDVRLAGLVTSGRYNASRFAVRAALAGTDAPADSMRCAVRRSLDDEHTPGVFEIIEIKTPETYKAEDGGYIQFRPVAYTQRERSVGSSTIAHVSDFNRTSLPNRSTVQAFYRDFDDNKLLVQNLYISFGEAGDGFYKQHNYTSWSFTIGYGAPPLEGFSLFVIVIICVGLGVPAVLALSGVALVLRRRAAQPRRLLEDH